MKLFAVLTVLDVVRIEHVAAGGCGGGWRPGRNKRVEAEASTAGGIVQVGSFWNRTRMPRLSEHVLSEMRTLIAALDPSQRIGGCGDARERLAEGVLTDTCGGRMEGWFDDRPRQGHITTAIRIRSSCCSSDDYRRSFQWQMQPPIRRSPTENVAIKVRRDIEERKVNERRVHGATQYAVTRSPRRPDSIRQFQVTCTWRSSCELESKS